MKIRIFTDGACSGNPGPGGWATIVLLETERIELSGRDKCTTNNRMELIAVIEALKYIKENKIPNKVDIYSDSAYVVNAVNNGWLKSWQSNGWKTKRCETVKNIDLWERFLHLLGKNKNIHLVKVKGHSGNLNNERADVLARKQSEKAKAEV